VVPGLKILFLAAEATPLAKVGGLADVAGELPRELVRRGIDVRLAMPMHATIDRSAYPFLELCRFPVGRSGFEIEAVIYKLELEGVQLWLIDGEPVRVVPAVYGQPAQDGEKYVFCAKAALLACEVCSWQPEILHANDWHAAAAINFLDRWREESSTWSGVRSLLTIHNLAYMGSENARAAYQVPQSHNPALPDWGTNLPLPSGIATADWVSTVSPSYAQEIQTAEYGCGLEQLLAARADRLLGILNGIDTEVWNPTTDGTLDQSFSMETIEIRQENTFGLQRELGLPLDGSPLIGMITRLDHQKGVDLALQALDQIAGEAWQFVLLGTGDQALEVLANEFVERYHLRARVLLRFDASIARRLYASCDMLLIPSRYEPCGLAQLIGMRYGAVPVVRGTGGLKDSVPDVDQESNGTGFVFDAADVHDLVACLLRALRVFQDKNRWRKIQVEGMSRDHSWKRTADDYSGLYQKLRDGER